MPTLLLVMLGSGLGAASRWRLDEVVSKRLPGDLPWGTFTINVSGSLLLGLVLSFADARSGAAALVALLGSGFCGGYTTFSTFAFQSFRMLESGPAGRAALNLLGSLAAGMVAAYLGWVGGLAMFG
ncbi:MAG: fluoride efflux transporter CrcB [Candidatus Nanopelagicales bacterium]